MFQISVNEHVTWILKKLNHWHNFISFVTGERAGAFTIVCGSKEEADRNMSQMKIIIRGMYSSPPIHGARIVTKVLTTPELKNLWYVHILENDWIVLTQEFPPSKILLIWLVWWRFVCMHMTVHKLYFRNCGKPSKSYMYMYLSNESFPWFTDTPLHVFHWVISICVLIGWEKWREWLTESSQWERNLWLAWPRRDLAGTGSTSSIKSACSVSQDWNLTRWAPYSLMSVGTLQINYLKQMTVWHKTKNVSFSAGVWKFYV